MSNLSKPITHNSRYHNTLTELLATGENPLHFSKDSFSSSKNGLDVIICGEKDEVLSKILTLLDESLERVAKKRMRKGKDRPW
jgi:hypothetical protein